MKRLIKAMWFISLLVAMGVMLYFYAALPEEVLYDIDNKASISRETYFYISLMVLAVSNFSLYSLSRNMKYTNQAINDILINWQLSFAVSLNFFFVVVMIFLYLINSGENFNYDHFGYLIFVSLSVIFIWILALPVLLIRKKSLLK